MPPVASRFFTSEPQGDPVSLDPLTKLISLFSFMRGQEINGFPCSLNFSDLHLKAEPALWALVF